MLTHDCWWIVVWFDQTCTAFFFPLRWKSNKCHECDIHSILQAIPAVQWCNYTQQFSSFQLESITNLAGKSWKHKGIHPALASPTLCRTKSRTKGYLHPSIEISKPSKVFEAQKISTFRGLMYTCSLLVLAACLAAWEQPWAKASPSLQ